MWVAYWTVAATNSPPDPKVPINQTQPRRVRIRTGLRMHAAGLVQTPNGPQQSTPSSDAANQYLYAGTRTQPTIHNLDVVI